MLAIEFAIMLGFDGQLEANSDMEKTLFASIVKQLNKKYTSNFENALIWLYVKSWDKFGTHFLEEKNLWNFGGKDLEAAIMALAYPRKESKSEQYTDLKNLIMDRFENKLSKFREWSGIIHNEVI